MAEWFDETFPDYCRPASVRMMAEGDFLRLLSRHIGLESTPHFEGLTEDEVRQIIRASVVIEAAESDVILRASDVGSEMYLLLDGPSRYAGPANCPTRKS